VGRFIGVPDRMWATSVGPHIEFSKPLRVAEMGRRGPGWSERCPILKRYYL